MYLAADVGTPLFKYLETPGDISKLFLIIGLILIALIALLVLILLILRKKVVGNEPSEEVFEDPFK